MSNNYPILDANSVQKTFKSTDNAGVHTSHHNIDALPDVTVATLPNVSIAALPAQHIDAFSRVRISNPGYRFDAQFTYQIDDDAWDVKEVGDGTVTHDATNRMVALEAGATLSANDAILQCHYHSPYTAARGQLPIATFDIPTAPTGNGEVGVGYFDGTNGVYLKKTATALTINLLTSTDNPDASVLQADWNIDPMDGTGPSGITLDLTKTAIFLNPLQALYAGEVTCCFDIAGNIVPFHIFNHSNVASYPYIAQASLPVRYWAKTNTDATASATINAICCSVISEGGADLQDIPGRTFVTRGTVVSAAAGTVLVIQPKAQLNGINQNALTIPDGLDVAVQGAGCWIEVRRNATITAGTFEDVDPLSTVEVSYAGNAGTDPVVTAGTGSLVDTFWVPASASIRTLSDTSLLGKTLLAYSHLLGVADNLAITYNGGSGSTDVRASLKWKEIR